MQRLPRRSVLTSLMATALLHEGGALSRAQSSTPETEEASAILDGDALLPRDVILPLDAV
jgi:hypothetical protein